MSINIVKEGKQLLISFKYDPQKVNSIKTIYNHRWNPEKKVWSIPYSIINLDKIRYLFSEEDIEFYITCRENSQCIKLL